VGKVEVEVEVVEVVQENKKNQPQRWEGRRKAQHRAAGCPSANEIIRILFLFSASPLPLSVVSAPAPVGGHQPRCAQQCDLYCNLLKRRDVA
jgi:hypothetical protein